MRSTAVLLFSLFAVSAMAEERLRVIDVHVHPEFSARSMNGRPATAEEFAAQWKRANLVGAVGILHDSSGKVPKVEQENIIYCAGIEATPNLTTLEAGLKDGSYRCMKIYLGYIHQYASDPRYQPVYQLAAKYDVPVIFHTGDTASKKAKLKYADPLTIDEVAVDYPKVTFVIAHAGNPWIESAAEVAYKNDNVYLDGSAFLIGDLRATPRAQVDRYMVEPLGWIFGYLENPEKLMFGSDWPLVDIDAAVEAFQRAIPREHWQAVFHDNAVRVFRLKP